MKKILLMILALAMTVCMTACGSAASNETISGAEEKVTENITIQALNANKETIDAEVPFDPERIAILDMPALDIIDALGIGDRIVGSAKVTIDYLEEYNPDDYRILLPSLDSKKRIANYIYSSIVEFYTEYMNENK